MESNIPRHVAIIMDGNGRWAHERNLPRYKGHEKGVECVEIAVDGCIECGIEYLTLFAFSTENWNRPREEVFTLMKFLSRYLDEKRTMLHEKKIRFNAIGQLDLLDKKIQNKIKRNKEESQQYSALTLTLALSYSGQGEIINAVKRLNSDIVEKHIAVDTINEEFFAQYMDTAGMPDPDLLIRTSGEFRISNFLLWQIAYTELVFIKKYWPDFTKEDVQLAVEEYKKRKRRFGQVV